jgi:hypothetical protein
MQNELFERKIMELKQEIQDKLHETLLGEPGSVEEVSPYSNIKEEANDFIEDRLERSFGSLRQTRIRQILSVGELLSYLVEIRESGHQAPIFREFLANFTDDDLRQSINAHRHIPRP